MVYPALTCTTYAAKSAFIERANELLRQEHNIMGAWHREGVPLETYQLLRADVQIKWPYSEKNLSLEEWQRYKEIRHRKLESILAEELGVIKNSMRESTRFSPNLDEIINGV